MAFNSANLFLVGSGPNGNLIFSYDAGSDAAATVVASGYINNTDDAVNLSVDDMVIAQCSDSTVTLIVTAVSSGVVTTRVLDETVVDTASTASTIPATGFSDLTSTGAVNYALAAPFKGAKKTLFKSASSTAIITVSTTAAGATFDGSSDAAAFNGAGDCLQLVGLSTTRWAVVSNTGSVSIS